MTLHLKLVTTIIFILYTNSNVHAQELLYKYDNASRLTEIQYPQQKKVNYTYDKDGNRTLKVESVIINIPTGIREVNPDATGLVIYPNPATNLLNIKLLGNLEKGKYEIQNSLGQSILHGDLNNSSINSVDISKLFSGVYFIQLTNGSTKYNSRFLKE